GLVPDFALAADHGTPHYVRVGPYSRPRTNLLAFAERTGMNIDVGCQWKGPYEAAERTGTATLSHAILSAAASIMRTTRHPLTPSARGLFPERMHSKKSSTSASSGSFDWTTGIIAPLSITRVLCCRKEPVISESGGGLTRLS